jgi:molybdopterin molybdotransferase
MDGYAVRVEDIAEASEATPIRLPVVGAVRAGESNPIVLSAAAAVRIFTGAPIPEGADAVVIQERVSAEGTEAVFCAAARPGDNIRRRGENQRAGTPFLPAGTLVDPGVLGWLASQDYAQLMVHRRPTVGLVSTGDELRAPGDPDRPGSIVDSNGIALSALVREAGGVPRRIPNPPDDRAAIRAALESASESDLIMTTGGASVGEHDLVREVVSSMGGEIEQWKVALKPGKPVMVGSLDGRLFVGLPGNAVSAMVTFEVFVRPALHRMLGDPAPYPSTIEVSLGGAYRHRVGRVELARASLVGDGDARRAVLHPRQSSAALESMVGHDVLVIFPAEQESFSEGERLRAIPRWSKRGSSAPLWP